MLLSGHRIQPKSPYPLVSVPHPSFLLMFFCLWMSLFGEGNLPTRSPAVLEQLAGGGGERHNGTPSSECSALSIRSLHATLTPAPSFSSGVRIKETGGELGRSRETASGLKVDLLGLLCESEVALCVSAYKEQQP